LTNSRKNPKIKQIFKEGAMVNRCESCPRNCCFDFKITTELRDPLGLKKELEKFPFIKRTGSEIVLDFFGHERMVGIYNCERFDIKSGNCLNYDKESRPEFCKNTGEKTIPHEKCLLKSKEDEKQIA
jgi:hypothetical protein